jgi:hypothetical protein
MEPDGVDDEHAVVEDVPETGEHYQPFSKQSNYKTISCSTL